MPIKLEEQELDQIKSSLANKDAILREIGARVIAYNSINNLVDQYQEIEVKQQENAKEINEKYGVGSINIETGEFTPSE